jgi:hypothetical protein
VALGSSGRSRQRSGPDRELKFPIAPHHLEGQGLADPGGLDSLQKSRGIGHRLICCRHHQITTPETGGFSRTALEHPLHKGTVALR